MKKDKLIGQSANVLYLAGAGNYTYFYFINAPREVFAQTLSLVALLLPQFIRIHKSYLINPLYITAARTVKHRQVEVLVGELWLPISKRRLHEVNRFLSKRNEPLLN